MKISPVLPNKNVNKQISSLTSNNRANNIALKIENEGELCYNRTSCNHVKKYRSINCAVHNRVR